MSKLTEHLRKHLRGDIVDKKSALEHFSTDGSIFKLTPKAVIYPRDVTDVRKVSKFSWQLAERGKKLPITVRGRGTDQGGGAIGDGLVLVLPAYMNRILDIDRESVTVEPGMVYGDLQRTLYSHGRFLPPFPASADFSTVGGAVANNACGEKSLKYGSTSDYVKELKVVLANGQVINTRRLNKRELNKKKGQSDFEGDIYRKIDGLLLDNAELIQEARPNVSRNTAGYALWDVRRPDGSFDLSSLIVGSQGTLGTVTEITFNTATYNPETNLLVATFAEVENAVSAVEELLKLNPSAMESVDHRLLGFLRQHHPEKLSSLIEGDELPKLLLLVEFDDEKATIRKRKIKKATKVLNPLASNIITSSDDQEQEDLWRVRYGASAVAWEEKGRKKAVPIIEDSVVPIERLGEFLDQTYRMFEKNHLEIAVWGHIGDANFHVQPFLDLNDTVDRQAVFRVMDKFYKMVFDMGGSTCGSNNDGRLRGPYLRELYGNEVYQLFRQVKEAFDPYSILNPGVKIDVEKDTLRKQLRNEYSIDHLYDHMPRVHH